MKSHVAIGFDVCPVCFVEHDESVLLDKRLKQSFTNQKQFVGYSLCDEHKELYERGFVALVVIDNNQTPTGDIAHIKKEAFFEFFNVPEEQHNKPVFHTDQETFDLLKSKVQ